MSGKKLRNDLPAELGELLIAAAVEVGELIIV